jgi:hypothetical protein
MLRGGSQNSETTFVNQLLILFHRPGLRLSGEILPPQTTIRTCLDRGALLPGVVLLGKRTSGKRTGFDLYRGTSPIRQRPPP